MTPTKEGLSLSYAIREDTTRVKVLALLFMYVKVGISSHESQEWALALSFVPQLIPFTHVHIHISNTANFQRRTFSSVNDYKEHSPLFLVYWITTRMKVLKVFII